MQVQHWCQLFLVAGCLQLPLAQCPADTYSANGGVSCTWCPPFSTTNGREGATLEDCVCQRGYYGSSNTSCEACGPYMTTELPGTLYQLDCVCLGRSDLEIVTLELFHVADEGDSTVAQCGCPNEHKFIGNYTCVPCACDENCTWHSEDAEQPSASLGLPRQQACSTTVTRGFGEVSVAARFARMAACHVLPCLLWLHSTWRI
mmetsp:Transcript_70684/g.132288  ORF Transcript_70684/g.132288 Transcript_70684/m.132288 type:complete len:203 (+) Transcript_70684:64-672(+)